MSKLFCLAESANFPLLSILQHKTIFPSDTQADQIRYELIKFILG